MDIWRVRLTEQVERYCAGKKISEAAFARSLELDPRRFNKYKTSQREPEFELLAKIARKLGTHPNYLLGFDDDPSWPKVDPLVRLEDKLDALNDKINHN